MEPNDVVKLSPRVAYGAGALVQLRQQKVRRENALLLVAFLFSGAVGVFFGFLGNFGPIRSCTKMQCAKCLKGVVAPTVIITFVPSWMEP